MEAFIGEIKMFCGNFAPVGWEFCNGQLLPIAQYDVLFALIGTTYGGDGQSTFAVPDLRGRLPIHQGSGFLLGQSGGVETVSLIDAQCPMGGHTHSLSAATRNAENAAPANRFLAGAAPLQAYSTGGPTVALAADSLAQSAAYPTGASQPHSNIQPYLCVNFIICYEGLFPSRS